MRCPSCNYLDTKVVDSREIEGEYAIRRRRECEKCNYRFNTYERIEVISLTVVKKDGRREQYQREKLKRGIVRAAEKRPITSEDIDGLITKVETELGGISTTEVTSRTIGEQAMKYLKRMDKVTYIRYASVYKEFEDLDSLEEELSKLLRRKRKRSVKIKSSKKQ
jgi:transcriptional repressor NrdR